MELTSTQKAKNVNHIAAYMYYIKVADQDWHYMFEHFHTTLEDFFINLHNIWNPK